MSHLKRMLGMVEGACMILREQLLTFCCEHLLLMLPAVLQRTPAGIVQSV